MLISCRTISVLVMGATVFAACRDTSVTGSFRNVYVADPSDVIVPIDLSQDQITVYVDGDDTPVPAQGFPDGTFTTGIEADRYDLVWRRASDGSVWLLAGNTGPRDHTIVWHGRPDPERPTQDTFLNLTADGLSPWSDGDELEILATNVNLHVRLDADTVTSGMTGFVNKQLNWHAAPSSFSRSWPLVDTSHGDAMRLLQYSQRVTSSGHAYRSLVRDGLVDEFALISGGTTDATVTMTQPAQTNVRIRVDLAQLKTMTPRVHPDAVRNTTNVRVRAIPKWREFGGFYGRGMALAELRLDQSWDDDLDDELSFADSTPSDWDRIIEVASWFTVAYINPETGYASTHPRHTLDDSGGFVETGHIICCGYCCDARKTHDSRRSRAFYVYIFDGVATVISVRPQPEDRRSQPTVEPKCRVSKIGQPHALRLQRLLPFLYHPAFVIRPHRHTGSLRLAQLLVDEALEVRIRLIAR